MKRAWNKEEDKILLQIVGDDTKTVKKITDQYNKRTRLKYAPRNYHSVAHRVSTFRRKHLLKL
uniref:Myb-like domain-containing protein n=1 Tax=viral metagenome TaxID=1070528 RepID=A0A6M3J6J3_9ZZZZ